MSSSEYIHMEIQAEILKRLPLKPLLRFRSVSKPWKRLIDSPDFRSFVKVFISPPVIVSYMCDKYIPVEILAEILKRLPLEPLLQFRSVSKPWKCLIDSRYFMAFYGVRHPQPHRFVFSYEDAYFFSPPTPSFNFRFVYDDGHSFYDDNDDDDDDDDDSSVDDYEYSFNELGFVEDDFGNFYNYFSKYPYGELFLLRDGYPCVVGSAHGLLCFNKKKSGRMPDGALIDMVVLWNPAIGKSVRIQLPIMYDFPNENYGIDHVIGFGVCPVTSDPTILKIECVDFKQKLKDMPDISIPWRVRVFTLSTGTWSILSTNLPRESVRLRGCQVVIDRFIYWLAFDMLVAEHGQSQSPFLIMSFDLIAKEFKDINLTDSLTNRLCSIQTISKLRESLVLLEYHREFEEDASVCCLWMMKEQGVNKSFTKLYNINLLPDVTINQILRFRKTGELILATERPPDGGSKLVIYDPNSEAIVNLDYHGKDYSFFMCSYMESLLLLDQLDGFMYTISN